MPAIAAVPQTTPAIGFRGSNPNPDMYKRWATANDNIPHVKQHGQIKRISPMQENKSPSRILRA